MTKSSGAHAPISLADRVELHEPPGRYGDAIDDRDFALQPKGLAGTASYFDDVVKTDHGWRVSHRVVTRRRRSR